ncbi:tetratricopeptide repeat protein 19, mitochondrial isoform X3 [Hippocampus zosterae]|uniref:tetratricopeptide repeat protein 19, mitochondrial isoform X3 n=1 Tax=Hippocampus zosterae TaxID=109293 RepID=UPI00223D43DC|nr:tetratricopeptide repeat protein 19, mitochondrial isoform X3 [Hippocampus zosterae]
MAVTCAQTLKRACMFMFGRPVLRPNGLLSSLCFANTPPSRITGICKIAAVTSQRGEERGRKDGRRGRGIWIVPAAIFGLFGSSEEPSSKEEELIMLLKKAKLSMLRGELEAASSFLHAAAAIAHGERHRPAIIYAYSQMANLAYVQGHLTQQAEKLFKAAMSYMLADGMPQDDNAFVEMSLKLATMYAQENKAELAEHGFRFCLETLEGKVQKLEETPADQLTEADEVLRKDTRLLLGLCLDSHARYLASKKQLTQAAAHYRKALDICQKEQGPHHHQVAMTTPWRCSVRRWIRAESQDTRTFTSSWPTWPPSCCMQVATTMAFACSTKPSIWRVKSTTAMLSGTSCGASAVLPKQRRPTLRERRRSNL